MKTHQADTEDVQKITFHDWSDSMHMRPWTWRDKLRCKLFPSQICELPVAPPEFKDVLVCKVTSELSMLDRLRVLVTGRIRVESRTVTENVIGYHTTNSAFQALPPRWWDRK